MVPALQSIPLPVSQHTALDESLIGGLGSIVYLVDFGPMAGLKLKLHGRLEEVHVLAQQAVDPLESLQGSLGGVAVITHEPPDYRPVLLLYMGVVVLLVGPRAREIDLVTLAIGVKVVVDELSSVVRVQATQRERQSSSYVVHGPSHSVLTLPPHSLTLYPAGGDVYCAQCVEVEPLRSLTTVSDQVHLQVSGLVLMPIGKGPNGDRRLQQAPRLGGAEGSPAAGPAIGLEQPVHRRGAHLAQLGLHLIGKAPRAMASKPESTEGRPWGQPLKKPAGAPLNLG